MANGCYALGKYPQVDIEIMQFIALFFIFCFSFSSLAAFELNFLNRFFSLNKVQNEAVVINFAQEHLSKTGILKRNKEGFVYLKVDDGYIDQLFPLLRNPSYERPPYFRRFNSPGAHISVFYVHETKRIGNIKEIGKRFAFRIKALAIVPDRTREYIVLKVASPELEQLRKKYGLAPFLNGHDFHITIAKKKRLSLTKKK